MRTCVVEEVQIIQFPNGEKVADVVPGEQLAVDTSITRGSLSKWLKQKPAGAQAGRGGWMELL